MTPVAWPRLLALSDLHVGFPENRKIIEDLRPDSDGDWLLLAGDVGELFADIEWVLRTLADRFATVVWTPGNHELWTHRDDPVRLRGEERYLSLVQLCRGLGVITPEDPYPVWAGQQGAAPPLLSQTVIMTMRLRAPRIPASRPSPAEKSSHLVFLRAHGATEAAVTAIETWGHHGGTSTGTRHHHHRPPSPPR